MRAVPESLDSGVVAEIDRRLHSVGSAHDVTILWAIESGSRAWGFPSPDSDYDCRFLFARPADHYLSLWPDRDVIETPLDEIFDVNGWDLAKAVKLVAKGNATAIEWLRSPIIYEGSPTFRDDMLEFAEAVVERASIGRHYLHVAQQQKTGSPSLKRVFYVLRPVMALRWLRVHPSAVIPPMDLPTLLAESDVERSVSDAITDLVAAKAITRELGAGSAPPLLERFIEEELRLGEQFDQLPRERDAAHVRREADRFFRTQLTTRPDTPAQPR
ncbi:MAG: nucleotidyltransferase domain-containing protein [Herbiconiux sp.]|nr:MAG: nucleotidyltransferase domain-containing protein [Herbiconiux sp.]